jgi:tripartite-type tricarboxylate transporter receptor subunit TctC
LVGGQIDMGIDSPTTTLPQVRAGTIKAYAVTAKSRLSAAPDIPTVDEAGLPGMYLSVWFGLWAPKGTPKDVISRLTNKRPKRLQRYKRPKSRNGGRSSRPPMSKANDVTPDIP